MRPGLLFEREHDDLDTLTPRARSGPAEATAVDLGLGRLYDAMARGDEFLADVARSVMPVPLQGIEAIRYRQAVLADCLANPAAARALYQVAAEAIDAERRIWGAGMRNPELVLSRAIEVLEVFLRALVELRGLAARNQATCESQGFDAFFTQLNADVDDAFLATARGHLANLRSRSIHVTARLGPGNRGTGYVLQRRPESGQRLRSRVMAAARAGGTLKVLLRDQNAMNTLAEVRALAIAPAAGALTESAGHILAFFRRLRFEMGFYVGCLNLHETLRARDVPLCIPEPVATGSGGAAFRGLRDPGLALLGGGAVIGNNLDVGPASLVLATGVSGGGKATFLRAVGLAQVMLQAGMFVAADAFRADLRSSVLTHFPREEDAAMERGRLDEELARLSVLVDAATPHSLVLMDESFASTNEREAAQVAHDVIAALVDSGVRVWFATHLHQYAADLRQNAPWPVLFVAPALGADGERTFRMTEAPPGPSSNAMDLFASAFGVPDHSTGIQTEHSG